MPTPFAYCRLAEEFIQNRVALLMGPWNGPKRFFLFCLNESELFLYVFSVLPLAKLRSAPSLLLRSLKVHRPRNWKCQTKNHIWTVRFRPKLATKKGSPQCLRTRPYWGSKKIEKQKWGPNKNWCPFPKWEGNVWHIHAAVFHLVLVALSASS